MSISWKKRSRRNKEWESRKRLVPRGSLCVSFTPPYSLLSQMHPRCRCGSFSPVRSGHMLPLHPFYRSSVNSLWETKPFLQPAWFVTMPHIRAVISVTKTAHREMCKFIFTCPQYTGERTHAVTCNKRGSTSIGANVWAIVVPSWHL